MVPVLTVRTFTRVTPSCAGIKPALDREGADAGEDVSAIRRGVDHVLVGKDLREQEIDIDVLFLRAADDRDLGGERMRAAEPVDLARVGRAHERRAGSRRAPSRRAADRLPGNRRPWRCRPGSACIGSGPASEILRDGRCSPAFHGFLPFPGGRVTQGWNAANARRFGCPQLDGLRRAMQNGFALLLAANPIRQTALSCRCVFAARRELP